MAASPIFVGTPKVWVGHADTAQTTRDNPSTNVLTLVTAGSSGSRVDYIEAIAVVATTAGSIRFYVHDGSTNHLWREYAVGGVTPSGTVQPWSLAPIDLRENPLVLQNGYSLRVTVNNSERIKVIAKGGDF